MPTDKHAECRREFRVYTQSWYSRDVPMEADLAEEIMVGMYHPEGGTSGEFALRWVSIGGRPVARLEAFDDSWSALQKFGDLLAWMATVDGDNVTPEQVAAAMREMGIVDATTRTRPAGI